MRPPPLLGEGGGRTPKRRLNLGSQPQSHLQFRRLRGEWGPSLDYATSSHLGIWGSGGSGLVRGASASVWDTVSSFKTSTRSHLARQSPSARRFPARISVKGRGHMVRRVGSPPRFPTGSRSDHQRTPSMLPAITSLLLRSTEAAANGPRESFVGCPIELILSTKFDQNGNQKKRYTERTEKW